MMHSLYFGDESSYGDIDLNTMVNTYDEWKIVPTSRPVIKPPNYKKKTLDIPGANGLLDISEAITGFPVYENRTGSIEFIVLNDFDLPDYDNYHWEMVYHNILEYLHGEEKKMVMEDEPGYFYKGRFTVNDWNSGKDHSTITINYDLSPYRWAIRSSDDPHWLWNPFNFEKDYIANAIFTNIVVNGRKTVTYQASDFGGAPLMPAISITAPMTITMTTNKGTVTKVFSQAGTYTIYELTIYKTDVTYMFVGTGTVSIKFYRGYL